MNSNKELKMKTWSFIGVVAVVAVAVAFLQPRPGEARGPSAAEPAAKVAAGVKTATLRVEGMTCASCTVTVRMVLKKLDGVSEATVKLDEKRARVQYDPARLTPQQLADAVTRAGYSSSVVPEPKA